MHYAGFWKRLVALVIDTLVILIASGVIGLALGIVMAVTAPIDQLGVGELLANLSGLLLGWFYYAGFESSPAQATPGKQLLGLRVTDLGGQPIGFGRASGRYFARILSSLILMIGYLMAAFTARKQSLHDLLSGCLVVSGKADASP